VTINPLLPIFLEGSSFSESPLACLSFIQLTLVEHDVLDRTSKENLCVT